MFMTIKLCTHAELFEIEIIIYIKMDLNNLQRLVSHKNQPTKPNRAIY